VPGFDQLLQARSGLASTQGGDGPPVGSVIPVHDVAAAFIAAFGILTALHSRANSGTGQEVSTSLTSVATIIQAGELTTYPSRPAPLRGGPDFPGPSAFRRYYRCSDGWIGLAAPSEDAAQAALAALGCELPSSARALDDANDGPLAERIAEALATLPSSVALDRLASRSVPCAAVLGRDDAMSDPWLLENGFFHEVEDRDLGTCRIVRTYGEWVSSAPPTAATAPRIGEHTVEILTGAGLSEDDVDALCGTGVAASSVTAA
jgi:crotonobetainyl-CoA:carnitine CoA-transferase CaiB-like acyl-CoA transferase